MTQLLPYLLGLAFLVGCSSQQRSTTHDPANILNFADGWFVLGAYFKKHETSSLIKDLTHEGIRVDRKLSIRAEPGTSRQNIEAVVAELRKAGYHEIRLIGVSHN